MSDSTVTEDENLPTISLEDEMKQSYLDYAMSVIVSRALPDVRDGLKPVHRRILYAMREGGYASDKAYKKSARIVGDVMGKYHPHGDAAIYDSMVRMAQPWSLRLPLVDGQGNFGSMDGDSPAAMRYTEARMDKAAEVMLGDIDKALDQADQDEAIVVLRSARPNIFSAGFDLKILAANDPHKSLEMVRAGAELALRLLDYPRPTIGIMEGHAFPMGTFLLLACDVRIAAHGPHKMGLNEVAIGITPPSFAVELARSRMHPAWLSRTAILGEMFEPEDALKAGLLDHVVEEHALEQALSSAIAAASAVHQPSHAAAKTRLRRPVMIAMREEINRELTIDAYLSGNRTASPTMVTATA